MRLPLLPGKRFIDTWWLRQHNLECREMAGYCPEMLRRCIVQQQAQVYQGVCGVGINHSALHSLELRRSIALSHVSDSNPLTEYFTVLPLGIFPA